MDRDHILATALAQRPDAVVRTLTTLIREGREDTAVLSCSPIHHVIGEFEKAGFCEFTPQALFQQDFAFSLYKGTGHWSPVNVWGHISWEGHEIEYVQFSVTEGMHKSPHGVLIGRSLGTLAEFVTAVSAFADGIHNVVHVFEGDCWSSDPELYSDIQNSSLDNIVLPDGMTERIRDDIQHWLSSQELYESHGIPWKRGIILVGPPGNGKTHLVKALVNHFGLKTLYVRSFRSQYMGENPGAVRKVFDRARELTPCALIFEDIDTLVSPKLRSYFLNELDGFAKNTGILTIATANDPAKLDPALVNRPSRFDRRYTFHLPELHERSVYLQMFTASLDPELRLTLDEAGPIAVITEGFSFAYLKELVLSSMMEWITKGRADRFSVVLEGNVDPLREQMSSDIVPTPEVLHSHEDDDDDE